MALTALEVEQHAQRKRSLVEMLIRVLLGLWGNFSQWDDADLVAARTAASIPHVESTLREMQRETRQFQMRALKALGVRLPKVSPPIDLYPRSRVDLLEVYARPARDAAKALAAGGSMDDAVAAFEKRLTGIVEADAMIAARDELAAIQEQLEREGLTDYDDDFDDLHDDDNASELPPRDELESWITQYEESYGREGDTRTESGEKIIGWRRVIRPELSMHGTCGLCVVAATQWYTKQNLKAMHHLCKCVTLPVTKSNDPGLRWNAEDLRRNLDEIYGAAGGSTSGKKLKRVRVAVREHGELGPILAYSAKRGWEPREGFKPYSPPNSQVQKDRIARRRKDLEDTLANLKNRLGGDGNQAGINHAIWEIEQSLRDLRARTAA